MTWPIHIDLNQLTQAHVDEAMDARYGTCCYEGPCIIGTLVPEHLRSGLDQANTESDTEIATLVKDGFVKFATPAQAKLAQRLQGAYDRTSSEHFEDVLHDLNPSLKVNIDA